MDGMKVFTSTNISPPPRARQVSVLTRWRGACWRADTRSPWCAATTVGAKRALGGAALPLAAQQNLAVQVRWLTGRLENHLLGNHWFANAKALVIAGLYFEGPEANAWLARGLRKRACEVSEQILPDGGTLNAAPCTTRFRWKTCWTW